MESESMRSAFDHMAHNLMTGNDWKLGRRRASFDFIQFRMADTAGCNPNQDFKTLLADVVVKTQVLNKLSGATSP